MAECKAEVSEQEKEKVINDCLPFIKYTACRLAHRLPPYLSVQDLISVGVEGLLSSLRRHAGGMAKINTFAEYRIKGAMLDELRSNDWVPRSFKVKLDRIRKAHRELELDLGRTPGEDEIAARLSISLDEYYRTLEVASNSVVYNFEDIRERMHEDGDLDVMENIRDKNMKGPLEQLETSAIKKTLAALILKLPEKEKLILSLYYWDELTLKEIGRIVHLTEGRVCQIRNQALMRLRAWMSLSPRERAGATLSKYREPDFAREEAGSPVYGEKYRILVVDGDESSRQMFETCLTTSGHVTVCVRDVDDVFDILGRDLSFDLVIAEVVMQRLTAFELRAMLRKHYSTQNIPVLAAGTFYDEEPAQNRHKQQIDGYVRKPVSKDVLLGEIRKIMKKRRTVRP